VERRIQKHSTRLSAAKDAGFHVGQRIRTLDGYLGRILMITESFSPGNSEYQVVLDSGMGGGTFLASQLRPVPEDYGGGHQAPAYLPAGVTAALEAEADLDETLASHWYPEMGDVLHERPDPGRQISVIAHYRPDDPYDREDPDSHNYGWCHVCGQHHESNEEAEEHDSASTDWRSVYKGLPSRMYRGLAMKLPTGLHEHVHDPGTPPAARAAMLEEHLRHYWSPLGMHWTPAQSQAEHYAEVTAYHGFKNSYSEKDPGITHVVVHAAKPRLRDIEKDPDTLVGEGVIGHEYHEDAEIPMQGGAPVRVTGLSWKQDNHPGWTHHQFRAHHEHLAAFYSTDEDPREQDYNGEPEVGGVYWGAPAQQQFVDDELGQPQPGPVEMVEPVEPGEEEEPGEPDEGEEEPGPLQASASIRDDKSDRWHEYNQAYRPGVVHRGIHIALPDDLHRYVHDESIPREDRAQALAGHFSGSGLGMHWTPHTRIAQRSIWNAAAAGHGLPGGRLYHPEGPDATTDVMFHAATGERNRIRDPRTLDAHDIGWAHSPDEDEFPVKPGSPMRLHGISWKPHEPEYPNEPFEHVDFPRPLRHTASVHVKHARVPWTGTQRELLHGWQEHPTATEGDFVNSADFTNKYPEPEPGPDPETEYAEAVGPKAFTEMTARLAAHAPHGQSADEVYAQLAKKFPPDAISWVHDADWEGPHRVPLDQVDSSGRDSWEASGDNGKVEKFRKKILKKEDKGKDPKPAILVAKPGRPDQVIADGHHRYLAEEGLEEEDPEREGLFAWTAHVPEDEGPWDQMHSSQEPDGQGDALDEPGPGEPPDDGMADSLEDGEMSATQPYPPPVTTGLPPYSQSGTPGPRTKNLTPVEKSPSFLLAHPELQQHGEPPPGDGDDSGDTDDTDDGDGKDKALDAFEKAAGSAGFRFEFTAAWRDVVAKAERIVRENGVRITALAGSLTVGEVKGDHATYETGLQYYPGRGFSVMAYSCGCPWATFWQNPDQPGRFAGRMCSHAYALGLAARQRGVVRRTMFPELAGWPETVVVKSEPPWHPSDKSWAQEQRAPMTSRPVLSSLIPGNLGEQASAIPAVTAARVLVDAGEDPAAVTILLRLAGFEVEADQANAPWGSQDVIDMPPQQPYGATSPPEKDRDPGSYGPLSGPDPDNWGEIQEDSAIQMPLTNEAARASEDDNVLDTPATNDWADEGQSLAYQERDDGLQSTASDAIFLDTRHSRYGEARHEASPALDTEASRVSTDLQTMDTNAGLAFFGRHGEARQATSGPGAARLGEAGEQEFVPEWGESFPYSDRAAAGGPVTSVSPRDPQGLRMEEVLGEPQLDGALAELKDEPEPALDPEGLTAADPSLTYPAQVGAGVSGQAQHPDQFTTQNPGMGSMDEPLAPGDSSIQTMGQQQWSGVDYNSGDLAHPEQQHENPAEDEDLRDIVASFQRSAAARQYTGDGAVEADGDIAAAARAYLSKTADVLPADEADELIREGRGTRARNLDLLDLQGTHYAEHPELDEHDDDLAWA
jgi:hypothetical protein